MSSGEFIAVTCTMASVLGVFLALSSRMNNNTLKEESRHTREILSRMEQGQNEARREMAEAIRYLADLIRSDGDKTRQMIRPSA